MKRYICVFLSLCIVFSFFACEKEEPAEDGYSFTDDLGRTVTVNAPERVACLLGSFADMWMLAGGTVCASADDAWEDFDLPLDATVVNLGGTQRPNAEALMLSAPDLVLASSKLSAHVAMMETLESAGIAVAYFDVADFEAYLRVLKIFTHITGDDGAYVRYGTDQQKKIDGILEKHGDATPCTVLVMRASAADIRAKNSKGTMLGGMLLDFGCVNIADSDSMLLEDLNIESILLKDPDKLFFVETGDDPEGIRTNVEKMFDENPLWKELGAVKNGQVYYMDKRLYNLKPNARFAEAYEKLENILYED